MDVYLSVLFLLLTGLTTCYGQHCDDDRLRRCKDDIAHQSSRRPSDFSVSDCRNFRENLDCLLDQTLLCIYRESEKEAYGNEISRAHDLLMRTCDREEGWNRNRCYQLHELQQCEERFPRRIYDADSETCRKYEDLKDCVERVLNSKCVSGDRRYLRSYYLDIARNLPWKCPTSLSSTSTRYPSYPDDSSYRNRTTYRNDKTCCKDERCEDRDRLLNCRQDLIQIVDGRSNLAYGNNQERCSMLFNKFNCLLWHTYNCQQRYEKDITNIDRIKRYILNSCDVLGDLRRSRCYEDTRVRDCDRYLQEETPSQDDVTCREYLSYYDCVQQHIQNCNFQEQLLQGFFFVNKVKDKAWTCSKKDTSYTGITPYDDRNTNPYYPFSTDDQNCEMRSRRDHQRCLDEKDKMDDEARRTDNSRERHIKGCCTVYKFRECIRQVVRSNCDRERAHVVDNLMGNSMRDRINQCQDVNQSTCSASRMLSNAIIIVLAVAIFRSIFQQ